nr:immunoglobulin heavy chain junction region [Mus musculus]
CAREDDGSYYFDYW